MTNKNSSGLSFLGIFLAMGIASGGYFIGQTLYNAKIALNTAEVKGLAERRVKADRVNWSLTFSVAGKNREQIAELYKIAEEHQQIITELLKENGFEQNEIEIGIIEYNYREYRDENQKLVDQQHQLIGSISVETNKVEHLSKVRANVNKLIAQGINISNGVPAYRFTKLNDIKPDMLREATKNARIAANEFAESAGVSVGGIRNARQGGFYIRDAGEEHGDTRKIEKDVRVVTTITFFLTD